MGESRFVLADLGVDFPETAKRHRLPPAMTVLTAQLGGLEMKCRRLGRAPEIPPRQGKIVEGCGFASPIPGLAEEIQGKLEAEPGSTVLARRSIGVATVVQHPRPPAFFPDRLEDFRGLGIARHRGIELAEAAMQHAEVVECPRLASPLAGGGE